jgi:superfamily II DNA or RNA helicase
MREAAMNEAEVIDARNEFLADLAVTLGFTWQDYQTETFEDWEYQGYERACLYYRTGAGKSITSLVMMKLRGMDEVLVIAPPSTHADWKRQAEKLEMWVETISHAKFRQKNYRASRYRAVIADEFHMFGGHGGVGFKRFDTLARNLQAPLILCSATPNYNDAERVYCIKHVLDPRGTAGGYLQFLYQNCNTLMNPFGQEPLVDEDRPFIHFDSAENFLRSLPGVYHVPDNVVFTIDDIPVDIGLPDELESHGYERRAHRMVASSMEMRHTKVQLRLIMEDGFLDVKVHKILDELIDEADTPVLVFAMHQTVAAAASLSMFEAGLENGLVDGTLSTKTKAKIIEAFKAGKLPVLIGTASLATGTDGLDKVCNTLIILDDTDDDAGRRQLIGRIMPRGADVDASMKRVHRIVLE